MRPKRIRVTRANYVSPPIGKDPLVDVDVDIIDGSITWEALIANAVKLALASADDDEVYVVVHCTFPKGADDDDVA